MIIFAGIVAGLPVSLGNTLSMVGTGELSVFAVVINLDYGSSSNGLYCLYGKRPETNHRELR